MNRALTAASEVWPLAESFVIARGAKTEVQVVIAQISQDGVRGWAECAPYPHFGETVETVLDQIDSARGAIEAGCDRAALQRLLPAGAARNALDCALWDLEAKLTSTPAHVLAGRPRLGPVKTAPGLRAEGRDA